MVGFVSKGALTLGKENGIAAELKKKNRETEPCHVGLSHLGLSCPQVTGGGYGLQKCRVAVNLLNKQSQTAYTG
jgi:hypothetical protein